MTNEESSSPQQPQVDATQKIFVSRIPTNFDAASVQRLLEEQLGSGTVLHVALAYEKEEEKETTKEEDRFYRPNKKAKKLTEDAEQEKQHRGYCFVTLENTGLVQKAIREIQTVRGGAKPTSTKKHTLYIGPCLNDSEEAGDSNQKQPCFLYAKGRCPYGDQCKFAHDGPPAGEQQQPTAQNKKAKKCRDHRKGKCKLGDACPFSHDFEPKSTAMISARPDSEKDCINWKTKGKCRKQETCPYRHDPNVQETALRKKQNKNDGKGKRPQRSEKQPLSVRVFGLNYDTQPDAIRALFNDCGPIVNVDFPTFEDSGRGKGYCGVTFQSPKAVDTAVRLSGTELDGRWLSVQAGKMMLEDWEQHHADRKQQGKKQTR